ncbi:MAG TPA: IPT/TIG domain-containing protein [Acidimicrobiia bacterium]
MGTCSFRRVVAEASAVVIVGASLAAIAASPASAHSGTTFVVKPYGTVTVSSLPTPPNVVAHTASTAARATSHVTSSVNPAFNTLGPNDLESQTSPTNYTNHKNVAARTVVARSATQVLEANGPDLRIYDSSGTTLQTVAMADFWKTASNLFPSSDDIAFDASAGRYYMAGDRSNAGHDQLIFAVSNTSDATGVWTLYGLESEPNKNRGFVHVRVGFGSDKILIGDDDVDGGLCSTGCRDGHLVVLQRSDALNQAALRGVDFNLTNGVAHPEFVTPAVPVPLQQKTTAYAAYMETNAGGHRAGVFVVTGTPATNNADYNEVLTGFTNNPNDPTTAREPGGLHLLPFGWDDLAQGHGGIAFSSVSQSQALSGSGVVLWLADNVECNPGGGNRLCVKLVRVQVNSAGTSVSDTWENTIKGAPNDDFYSPSVVAAPASGRAFVEYTHSTTTLPPRAEIATFVASGTATINNLREVSFAAGTTPFNDGNGPKFPVVWGSSTIVADDPQVDTVWAAGFAATSSTNTWQNQVAQYTVNSPILSSLSPAAGPPGTAVTIDGSGFTRDAIVAFGAVPSTNVRYNGSGELVASAPAQPAGNVNVTVTTPKGTTAGSIYVYPAVAWTTLNGSAQVQAFNTSSGTGPTIAVAAKPQGIAATPDGTRVVVATSTGATVLDTETHTAEATFAFAGADDVAISPNGNWAYVTTPTALQVIDMTGPTPVYDGGFPVPGAGKLHDVAITSDGTHALITDPTANKLWNVTVGSGFVNPSPSFTSPEAITVHGNTAWLTTKAASTGSLIELNASTLATLGTDGFDGDPMAVATSPAGDYVYVSLTNAGRMMAFHHTAPGATTPVGATTLTGDAPLGLAVLPNGTAGFVALNATTAPAQLEVFASPPPGAGPVSIKGKNPFDVAIATPLPIICGAQNVTPLTVTPSETGWPTHDDFSVIAQIGSCGDDSGMPLQVQFRETFTPPTGCVAPPPGVIATTLPVGHDLVPAQYVATHCTGNWSVKVVVTNTLSGITIATATEGFVVS